MAWVEINMAIQVESGTIDDAVSEAAETILWRIRHGEIEAHVTLSGSSEDVVDQYLPAIEVEWKIP